MYSPCIGEDSLGSLGWRRGVVIKGSCRQQGDQEGSSLESSLIHPGSVEIWFLYVPEVGRQVLEPESHDS